MARTGLYQLEVKKARDALIAQGKHPSVDAVRVALGNTGSKTTIHKYLKELEEQDGGAKGGKATITEALQDLVERLAARIHEEGNARIEAIEAQGLEKARLDAETLAALRKDVEALAGQRDQLEDIALQERTIHEQTRTALHSETIALSIAEQQVIDLRERLLENEAHRLSLEEKHKHAREALEHYRQSVKEQRDQDQRRHEQQVQQLQAEMRQLQQSLVVKQDDITRLNQEGARLVADLSHAQTALYDQQSQGRQQALQMATLQEAAQQARVTAAHLAGVEVQAQALQRLVAAATENGEVAAARVRELELALTTAQATLASQQEIAIELRAHLATRGRIVEGEATKRSGT